MTPPPCLGHGTPGQTLQPVLCPTSCLAACPSLVALGGPGLSPSRVQSHLPVLLRNRSERRLQGLGYLVRDSSTFLQISLPTHSSAYPSPHPIQAQLQVLLGPENLETLNIPSQRSPSNSHIHQLIQWTIREPETGFRFAGNISAPLPSSPARETSQPQLRENSLINVDSQLP